MCTVARRCVDGAGYDTDLISKQTSSPHMSLIFFIAFFCNSRMTIPIHSLTILGHLILLAVKPLLLNPHHPILPWWLSLGFLSILSDFLFRYLGVTLYYRGVSRVHQGV